MKIGNAPVRIFKIKNRRGFAAVCRDNLTEGTTRGQAFDRMVKAVRRSERKSRP
jgi:hypothetical protein